MQVTKPPIEDLLLQVYCPKAVKNTTLSTLLAELGVECQNILALIHQLQLPSLNHNQTADVLAELTASVIHLQTHCGSDLQDLIADELDSLPEDLET
jgi:acyl-homoserine lactone acylase PvdQ